MGTRNFIVVIDEKGEKKIGQYGQWDGYLENLGINILQFLKNPKNVNSLKDSLYKLKFISFEEENRIFLNNDWYYDTFLSRDLSDKVLSNIIGSKMKEIELVDYTINGYDSFSVEYAYEINFKENKFKSFDTHQGVHLLKEYDLNNLPDFKHYLAETKNEQARIFGIDI